MADTGILVPQIKIFHSRSLDDLKFRVNQYLFSGTTGLWDNPSEHIKVEIYNATNRQQRQVYYLDTEIHTTINASVTTTAASSGAHTETATVSVVTTTDPNIPMDEYAPNNEENVF
jgi:hypothetical protein